MLEASSTEYKMLSETSLPHEAISKVTSTPKCFSGLGTAFRVLAFCVIATTSIGAEEPRPSAGGYEDIIKPILIRHCYDCHADGANEGGVALDDAFRRPEDIVKQKKLWLAILNNVRAGLMPPPGEAVPRPSTDEVRQLVEWIKTTAFEIDYADPDPGHVVPRRLNRIEYQNTIRDLLSFRFPADQEFPPDDTGSGFDNNGDVLTLSPLLIEKYLTAAETIVSAAVPQSHKAVSIDAARASERSDDGEDEASYVRIFTDGPPPADISKRDRYAAKILRAFASRAFRRPAEEGDVSQLVRLASSIDSKTDVTFEQGVSRAMMAVLASPKFLFRIEQPIAGATGDFVLLDEYSLASRLSYFLWSSMPDDELFALAKTGQLRKQLSTQIQRMLKDPKIDDGLVRNFTGQWLRTRDVDSVEINGKAVLGKGPANGNRRTKYDFDGKIRRAMRSETERYFAFVLEENRSVLEFVDSNYAFLNERLAQQYDIPDVKGDKLRHVTLPKDSFRGGVLTHGSVLAVTSNPTRTSPVKRGVFVLENILGTPPPPPPANVADLDAVIEQGGDNTPTLSEALAQHRADDVCSSCHNRMDPIGLAFENFIPMGNYRNQEAGHPIHTDGQLITGERFRDIRDLKHILANERRTDFYRCLSRKMLIYAIGRSLDYRDTHTVDVIVKQLEDDDGRIATLITSIVESPAFQKQGR